MKLNLAIFILFLGIFSGLYAMEQDQPNQQIINLKLSDEQIVSLPAEVALHSSLIRSYLEDNEIRDESPIIDLSEVVLQRKNGKKRRFTFSPEIVSAIFDVIIHGKRLLHNLSNAELTQLFHAGDFLKIPQKTMRKITRYIQKKIEEDKQPALIKSSHYCNSIHSLYRNDELKYTLQELQLYEGFSILGFSSNGCFQFCLDLSDNKIDTLLGIENLAKKFENCCIREIFLNENALKIVDVAQLIKIFPFLQTVKAEENNIETIMLPEMLPENFQLLLRSNKITNLGYFKLGKCTEVDLSENPLSNEAQEILKNASKQSVIEHPVIQALVNKETSSAVAKAVKLGLGTSIALIPWTACVLRSNKRSYTPIPLRQDFAYFAATSIMLMGIYVPLTAAFQYIYTYPMQNNIYKANKPKIQYDQIANNKKIMRFRHFFRYKNEKDSI